MMPKMLALRRLIERYRVEIHARQAEEDIAAEWLVEFGISNTANSGLGGAF